MARLLVKLAITSHDWCQLGKQQSWQDWCSFLLIHQLQLEAPGQALFSLDTTVPICALLLLQMPHLLSSLMRPLQPGVVCCMQGLLAFLLFYLGCLGCLSCPSGCPSSFCHLFNIFHILITGLPAFIPAAHASVNCR